MRALVDGDIIAYSCSCITDGKTYTLDTPYGEIRSHRKVELNDACDQFGLELSDIQTVWEPEPISHTCNAMKKMLKAILKELDIFLDKCEIYLSDTENFRQSFDPHYKANRISMRVPKNLIEAKNYLRNHWEAQILPRHEADDILGIIQMKDFRSNNGAPDECKTIICTLDKDLNMIPGWHYNWRTKETYWVHEEDAMRCFYEQLLKGDKVDNIIGLQGIGEKRAAKMLEKCTTEQEMYEVCVNAYYQEENAIRPQTHLNDMFKTAQERCHTNAKLLWILREPHKYWEPPGV